MMVLRWISCASMILLAILLMGCGPRTVQTLNNEVTPLTTKVPISEEGELAASKSAPNRAAEIAFLSDRDHPDTPGLGELYLMMPDGSGQRRLSCDLGIRGALAGDLSDVSGRLSWSASMQSFLLAFGDLQRINLANDSFGSMGLAAWHIDISNTGDTFVAMVHNRVTGGDIAILNLDGLRPITLTDGTTRALLTLPLETPFYGPAISPDGNNIAFLSLGKIFQISRNGLSPSRLTSDIRATWPLSWSPDGKQIVFQVMQSGRPVMPLKIISIENGRVRDFNSEGSSPAWSPDGGRIAFTRSDRQIWLADVDGTNMRQLTSVGQNCCPIWITNPETLSPYVKTECARAISTTESQATKQQKASVTPHTPERSATVMSPPTTAGTPKAPQIPSCSEIARLAHQSPAPPLAPAVQATLEAQYETVPLGLLGVWCVDQPENEQIVVFDPTSVFSWSGELGWYWHHGSASSTGMIELYACRLSSGKLHWEIYGLSYDDDGTVATLSSSPPEETAPIVLRKLADYTSEGSISKDIVGKWRRVDIGSEAILEFDANSQIIEHLQDGKTNPFGQYGLKKREGGAGYEISFRILRARFSLPIVMGGSTMVIGDRCDETPDNYHGLDAVSGIFVRIE